MPGKRLAAVAVLLLGGAAARADLFPCRCQQNERPCCPPYDHPTYGYYQTQWSAWSAGAPVVGAVPGWQSAPPPKVETSTFAPPPRVDIPPVYTPMTPAPQVAPSTRAMPTIHPELLNLGGAPVMTVMHRSAVPTPVVIQPIAVPAAPENAGVPLLNLR